MSVFLSSGSPTRSVRHPALEPVEHVVGDRLLHQQPRAGAADVALVEEDAVDDALDGLVDRRVVEDDVGGLAAELEGDLLVGAGDRPGDLPADLGGAGEGDLVDVGVRRPAPAGLAGAGDDVDDARRQVGLLADLGEEQRGERGGLGRLEHHGVAAGQRRRDLPRQHQQREVPRDDLAGDARAAAGRWPGSRRSRACRPSRRSRRSARRPAAGRRRGTPGSACRCRGTRARRARGERSWRIRAMRKRYLPRSRPRQPRPDARCTRGGRPGRRASTSASSASATSASTSSVAGLIVLNEPPRGGVDELAVDEQAVGGRGCPRSRGTRGAGA